MRAMILAAGFGTRLWPLTIGRTKPAIPFLDRPLIAYTLDYLKNAGIDDVVINLHHEPASVQEQIGDGSHYGVRIHYSLEEPVILGTAGALDNVRELLSDDTFVVINGKIISDIDLKAAIDAHQRKEAMATLVLLPNPAHAHFSEVRISNDERIESFAGFPDPHEAGNRPAPLMFTGIHILDPSIFKYIPRRAASDSVRDVYPAAMAEGELVMGYVASGNWYELSTLERYLAVSIEFLARSGRDWIAGEDCRIDPTARVSRSVLWRSVSVGKQSELVDCVVGDNVRIPDGEKFSRVVIIRADVAEHHERPEKARSGEIRGENLVVAF